MPSVSVIIPNYNHACYLPKRIESVLNQTYQDFEIILMDDCSTDNSREIILEYAKKDDRINVLFNNVNSGSTFKQWNKGVKEAKGEYIWLAESDDYAEDTFLEVLVSNLKNNPKVNIAYCQSIFVNEENQIITSWVNSRDDIDKQKWQKNFVEEGISFIQDYLTLSNFIPNASAVLIKRSAYLTAKCADETYKLTGDWKLWVDILLPSYISYIATPLSYFRQHTQNVRSNSEKNGIFPEEMSKVLVYISNQSNLNSKIKTKMLWSFFQLWAHYFFVVNIPFQKSKTIYQNLKTIDGKLDRRLVKFIFKNRLFKKLCLHMSSKLLAYNNIA